MNEPYQRVHKQEDSNSTLYKNIGIDVATGLGMSAAFDAYGVVRRKMAKTDLEREHANKAFFTDFKLKEVTEQIDDHFDNKLTSKVNGYANGSSKMSRFIGGIPVYGTSTTKGRIFNYGIAVGGGILTGALRTGKEEQ